MVNAVKLDKEVARFFEWVKHFEAEVHMLGGGARRYVCNLMQVNVRYSWFKASVAGVPSVCLADLVLSEHSQGFAFLERLVKWFARVPHELEAQVLYVEQPRGEVLPIWLSDNGFSLCAAPGEELHSWYLRRSLPKHHASCAHRHAACQARRVPTSSAEEEPMPHRFLDQLSRKPLPIVITDARQLAMLRQLLRAGYVDGRLYHQTPEAKQFGEVNRITPLGERVRRIFQEVGAHPGLWPPTCEP